MKYLSKLLILFILITQIPSTISYAFPQDKKTNAHYRPNEIIVKFKQGTSLAKISSFFSKEKQIIRHNNKLNIDLIKVNNQSIVNLLEQYRKLPEVEYAEPNLLFHSEQTPNDTYFNNYQWDMKKINTPFSLDLAGNKPNNVKIAVVDTGIQYNHPDLVGKVIRGYDYVDDNWYPNDKNGHGTHVAGVIGAIANNGLGIAGINPNARILDVRVLDENGVGTLEQVANGIMFAADQGAKVINLSLATDQDSITLKNAINYAWNKGAVIVAAAGNESVSKPNYPADYSNVISVAATDQNDRKANFSNYGKWVDVAAPGVNIYSTYKDNRYVSLNGTSMATPHVAGLAGLLAAQGRSNSEIISAIENTSDRINDTGSYWRFGRINISKALNFNKQITNPTTSEPESITDEILNKIRQTAYQHQVNREKLKNSPSSQTNVSYQNTIDNHSIHEFWFSTTDQTGVLNVKNLNSTNDVSYAVIDTTTLTVWQSGEQLPPGNYLFVVFVNNKSLKKPVEYHYILSGLTFSHAPTTLPKLSLNDPSSYSQHLNKGLSEYTVSGTSNSVYLEANTNNTNFYSLTSPGSFSKSLPLPIGSSKLNFYAQNNDGNGYWSSYDIVSPGLKRLSGKDRFEVSNNVSKEINSIVPNSDTIVIARGDLFTDALSGVPLAATMGHSPVLLTTTNSLPASIQTEINHIHPTRAIILGGMGSVSKKVEQKLKSLGIKIIERISGSDRFVVSANIAKRVVDFSQTDTAIIASGITFPDALSASSIAAAKGMPILLVGKDNIPTTVLDFLKHHKNIKKFIIVGGPGTVSENVQTQLSNYGKVHRISGSNRYEVAINFAKYFNMKLSSLVFARGDLFADALSGGPLAAYSNSPILLTPSKTLDLNVKQFLHQHPGEINSIYVLGGTASVSKNIEQQLYDLIQN